MGIHSSTHPLSQFSPNSFSLGPFSFNSFSLNPISLGRFYSAHFHSAHFHPTFSLGPFSLSPFTLGPLLGAFKPEDFREVRESRSLGVWPLLKGIEQFETLNHKCSCR